jgi:hypothetical protein
MIVYSDWLDQYEATGDSQWGRTLSILTNKDAPAVNDADIAVFAARLGCTAKQVQAVAKVESAGTGYTNSGLPKQLFERHYFHRLTEGEWTPSIFSQPKWGGYSSSDTWERFRLALERDPWAAYQSASWGKFQVMGAHWKTLGYPSPYSMAWTLAQSEADHYEMLARFIEANNMKHAMQALSTNPETCREFARKYNGPQYSKNQYHKKLAEAMQ